MRQRRSASSVRWSVPKGNPMARVINVDKNPCLSSSHPYAQNRRYDVSAGSTAPMPLLRECGGAGPRGCEETRTAGKRVRLVSERVATLQGIETINIIRTEE